MSQLLGKAAIAVVLALGSASTGAQTLSMTELPQPPAVQGSLDAYRDDLSKSPASLKVFEAVFGQPASIPLSERARLDDPKDYNTLTGEDIAALGVCGAANCLVIGHPDERRYIIYRSRVDTFRHLLGADAERRTERECERNDDRDCGAALPARLAASHRGGPRIRLSADWLDAFDGAAISWEPLTKDDQEGWADLKFAQDLTLAKPALDCSDYEREDTGTTVAEACGQVMQNDKGGNVGIYYCLQQPFPGFGNDGTKCFPLYRQVSGRWEIANLAGQIEDDIWGGDVYSPECTYESHLPPASQAQILSQAFSTLTGSALGISPGAGGSFKLGAVKLNANFAKITRKRPWAFLKVGLRLKVNDEKESRIVSTFSYTLSARRMVSRNDGREPGEDESAAIADWLQGHLNRALKRLHPSNLSCDTMQ